MTDDIDVLKDDLIVALEERNRAEARVKELEQALKESDGRVGSMQQDYEAEHERAKKVEAQCEDLRGEAAALREALETISLVPYIRNKMDAWEDGYASALERLGAMASEALAADAGAPEAAIIKAARPFMKAVPSWDCNEDDTVAVVVTARQTAALCRAFDAMDGDEDALADIKKA